MTRFPATGSLLVFFFLWAGSIGLIAQSTVSVDRGEKGFHLSLNQEPFFIRGVNGRKYLAQVREAGGNSIRTYAIENLAEQVEGKPLADRAHELGLMISAGIWIGHERHGFDYSNPAKVQEQREKVRAAVRRYKDHQAILVWGLGNEVEGPKSEGINPKIWEELNTLAGIIKQEDSRHPVMIVIAGASETKVRSVLQYCPNIDILGVNAYGNASGVGAALAAAGWNRAFILTEFGPLGPWESNRTPWGAPIEATANEKAGDYYATQTLTEENSRDRCLGTYAFLWGNKQETTSTWFGMFLPGGEKLPQVDAMSYVWNGKWPENRCPNIRSISFDLKETTGRPGMVVSANALATDADNDPLAYEWIVVEESRKTGVGGDYEDTPPARPECLVAQKENQVTLKTPAEAGAYRLFLTVRDGRGAASTANIPFAVR